MKTYAKKIFRSAWMYMLAKGGKKVYNVDMQPCRNIWSGHSTFLNFRKTVLYIPTCQSCYVENPQLL